MGIRHIAHIRLGVVDVLWVMRCNGLNADSLGCGGSTRILGDGSTVCAPQCSARSIA